ncbi:hypothetical protein GCM10011507_26680 [Edaphobacter acidisoli]|uniref:Cytochrome c domain-containing protein n=1 Tax=Edaphobacter acidisoli TaxID=2040573 RepID=A0A916RW39_9BACT|nr:cytochrome c [Edaphobacter acidisoli]GGA73987.1 hypothetical protein GCM10011507_26680 [Edaphobacter acidisoli]
MIQASHPFRRSGAFLLVAICFAALGCNHIPGRPGPGPEVVRPEQVLDFPTLYKQNCSSCHGVTGKDSAALPLDNPVYLALSGEDNIRKIIAGGVSGKLMPSFAKSAGGYLTDQQVSVLAHGVMQTWGKPGVLDGQNPPPYAATQQGDVARGQQAFTASCAHCHGANGEGSQNGKYRQGSIVDPSYLALISDQGLRSIIIAGLPDRHMPDWRGEGAAGHPAQPLTDQQITDIVAWLASHRTANPGQPYPTAPSQTSAGAAQ